MVGYIPSTAYFGLESFGINHPFRCERHVICGHGHYGMFVTCTLIEYGMINHGPFETHLF